MRFQKKIKTTLPLLLLAALLLSGTALGDGDFEYDFSTQSLEEIIFLFMDEHGLNEKNFSMGWYDLESSESWFFNEDKFMVAGSMYKLPLNMAYTDLLASGQRQPEDRAGPYNIARAMEMSIIYSSNPAAENLARALRLSHRDYRLMLAQYSGMDDSELPEEYFSDNRMSPRFIINTLVYLYDNSELYSQLIEYMKQAHIGRYFKKDEGEYEIAHKYGYYEGALDDCCIVYTPRPFALVAFTKNVVMAEDMLSELCTLMTEYSLYLDALPEPTPTPTPTPTPSPTPEPTPTPTPTPEPELEPLPEPTPEPTPAPERTVSPFPLWSVYAAVCALLLCLAFIRRRRRRTGRKGAGK